MCMYLLFTLCSFCCSDGSVVLWDCLVEAQQVKNIKLEEPAMILYDILLVPTSSTKHV